MNVKSAIADDGVGMRWVRTAATTVAAVASAAGALAAGFLWVVEPRAIEWTTRIIDKATSDLRAEIVKSSGTLDRLDSAVDNLEGSVVRLEAAAERNSLPSWRFSVPETEVSDGQIGGVVTINVAGYQLRDCGVPVVDLYFQNGGGVYHRFEAPSVLTRDGRGVALPVDPGRLQRISYIARIPSDDGVMPGRSLAFIAMSYPDACPVVSPAIAGPLQFRIWAES